MITMIDTSNIRMQGVLPFFQNEAGESLQEIMIRIDAFLKDVSPDAMAPGILNWGRKDLFTSKWERKDGEGTFSYNQAGESKIGRGRYEIVGTGEWEFNRFLAVSSIRGVTQRAFVGATQNGATVSIGINCYGANYEELGNNGGLAFHEHSPIRNGWDFYKTSAFGESINDRFALRPGTRYVKLSVKVLVNPDVVYFDETEMTVFEQDERYREIYSNNFDWMSGEIFKRTVSSDAVFTFSNTKAGSVKNIMITNSGQDDIFVDFPTAKWQGDIPLRLIRAGRTTVFTFISTRDTILAAAIEEIG